MSIIPVDVQARREERTLTLRWSDGSERRWTCFELRCLCPCAACVDENTGQRILDPATVPADVTIAELRPVGRYALKIVWTDGHSNGLYTWESLRGA